MRIAELQDGADALVAMVVLADGETYGGIDGASIMLITPDAHEKLCEGYQPKDLVSKDVVLEVGLTLYGLKGGG